MYKIKDIIKKKNEKIWFFFGGIFTLLIITAVCSIVILHHNFQNNNIKEDDFDTTSNISDNTKEKNDCYIKLQTAIDNNDIITMSSLYKNDDLLDYKEAVANYEKFFLGNTNANILQEGKICICNDYSLDATDGTLKKQEKGKSKILVNDTVSFVNEWNGVIYYRLDSTKKCMAYENDTSAVAINNLSVGQILIDNGIVYFINLDDGAYLYSFDIESGEVKLIVESAIQYFAIVGNKLLTLSRENSFVVYDKINGDYIADISNVKSFVLNDELYLSDGKNIVSCNVNLRNEKKITTNVGYLVAVFDTAIVLQNDTTLIYVDNSVPYLIETNVGICKFASVNDGTLNLIIGRSTEDGYLESKINRQLSDIVHELNIVG